MAFSDPLPIAVRAFLKVQHQHPRKPSRLAPSAIGPSEYVLVFDTETTTDAAQQLRFGVYQVRCRDELQEAGLFYDPLILTAAETATLRGFAENRNLPVHTVADFIELVFFPISYELRGTVIGFNLPFDISRLAIGHTSARGRTMRGGFSFKLSPNRRWPRLQVKHLSRRASLIQFAGVRGNLAGRGMRRRRMRVPTRRGAFVDVRTIAASLLSGSFTLKGVAEFLEVPHAKFETDEHGGLLTTDYLTYAERDVQTTWECFVCLRSRYETHSLSATPLHRLYSEAGLGKAYLRQMGIKPWQEVQPDVDPALIGRIVSSYYGGRSEVRIRREVRQVAYCDFLSMYPTVCILMRLWRFVIASGFDHADATDEIRELLTQVALENLADPTLWRKLAVLVEVLPSGDLFPVRAKYGHEAQYTIGLNHLSSEKPLWFTLADCIAATLLGGKPPAVVRAIRFVPRRMQRALLPVAIAGNPNYRINPTRDDFYKRLIELRAEIKERKSGANAAELEHIDTEQRAIKILANSTSYGIFFELNVVEELSLIEAICHGPDGSGFPVKVCQTEEPGRHFHPLLATLITGAARLMLAVTERLILDNGLEWMLCDTDSMAIAKPRGMREAEFHHAVQVVRDWFRPLNPYSGRAGRESVLKLEDANSALDGGSGRIAPLYGLAISPKRYALFNIDNAGKPILRKATAHGLGHLRAPYTGEPAVSDIPAPTVALAEIGVERWQHDVWYRILTAAVNGHPEQATYQGLPNFGAPAVSRYAATTPRLLEWFKDYNRRRPYRDRVRPFGFMLAFQGKRMEDYSILEAVSGGTKRKAVTKALISAPRAVAPFDHDAARAAGQCFDRKTGKPVPRNRLKSYREALVRYHLHPDPKAGSADYTDRGVTGRRHILAAAVQLIGKEANRWEEQFHLGVDPEAQSEFGFQPEHQEAMLEAIRGAAKHHGVQALARKAGLSRQHVAEIVKGKSPGGRTAIAGLAAAAAALDTSGRQVAAQVEQLIAQVRERCGVTGLRSFARLAHVNSGHLGRILAGSRQPSEATLARLRHALRIGRNGGGDPSDPPAVAIRATVSDPLISAGAGPSSSK